MFVCLFIYLFIYLWLCWVFASVRGPSPAATSGGHSSSRCTGLYLGPVSIAASLVAEHRLQTHRLSNCGSPAQPLRGMWDSPRPGLEPVSPALAGRLSTTAPPGKPKSEFWSQRDLGFVHSFICGFFTEPLLCAKHCVKC